jgi:glucosamine kinase
MNPVIGIDGGGSTVRISVLAPDLTILAEYLGPTVNPSIVGRDEAAARVQTGLRAVLNQANLTPDTIAGVGIGIAGAANRYDWSTPWLRQTVLAVLPETRVVPSSDFEIALVGAHGQRLGLLLLAGTGSLAYGVNAAGDSWLVGGWGYLLGDEGSGYWLGWQALQAAVRQADGRGPDTLLSEKMLAALNLSQPLDLITWIYQEPRVREVARLAPLVLECAAEGDALAREIVQTGALELALAVRAVRRKLKLHGHQPAFAGSLLTNANPLNTLVCDLLGLESIPLPQHPPVVGAALLALT